jgi:hypothetical protein
MGCRIADLLNSSLAFLWRGVVCTLLGSRRLGFREKGADKRSRSRQPASKHAFELSALAKGDEQNMLMMAPKTGKGLIKELDES